MKKDLFWLMISKVSVFRSLDQLFLDNSNMKHCGEFVQLMVPKKQKETDQKGQKWDRVSPDLLPLKTPPLKFPVPPKIGLPAADQVFSIGAYI